MNSLVYKAEYGQENKVVLKHFNEQNKLCKINEQKMLQKTNEHSGIKQPLRVGLTVHELWLPLSLLNYSKYLCKSRVFLHVEKKVLVCVKIFISSQVFGLTRHTFLLCFFFFLPASTSHLRMSTHSVYFLKQFCKISLVWIRVFIRIQAVQHVHPDL